MAAGLQPDRAVIVEPDPDGVSALGEIEGFDRMTGCGPQAVESRPDMRLPHLSSTRSASSEANLSLYSTLGFILFVVLSVVPLRTVNRWLGQFIDKLVAASDPLNNDRKWRRRVDLWLPDKIFRQPGACSPGRVASTSAALPAAAT